MFSLSYCCRHMNTADGRHRPSVLWAYAAIDGLSVKTDEAKLLGVLKMDNDCENKVLLFLRYYKTDLQLTFFFDSGNGSRRRLVTTTRLHEDHIQEEYATLLGLHAFSGSDSSCSFVRTGNMTVRSTVYYPFPKLCSR